MEETPFPGLIRQLDCWPHAGHWGLDSKPVFDSPWGLGPVRVLVAQWGVSGHPDPGYKFICYECSLE